MKWATLIRMELSQWANISQIVIAVSGVVALIIVCIQLDNIRNQNDILYKTLSEDYRPVGSIGREVKNGDMGYYVTQERLSEDRADRFGLKLSLNIRSIGNGILVPRQIAMYVSEHRSKDLVGEMISGALPVAEARPKNEELVRPMSPGDTKVVVIEQRELKFADHYYMHVLFVYADIATKYYATSYVLKLSFGRPTVAVDGEHLEATVVGFDETESYLELSEDQLKWMRKNMGDG